MSQTNDTHIEKLIEKVFQLLQTDFETGQNSGEETSKKESGPDHYSSVEIIHAAKDISNEEAALLEKAALLREEALTKLRKNEFVEGSRILKKTEEMVAELNLCKEASLIAATYQASADGFVHLKSKEYEKAIAAMFKAIETNQELYRDFDHSVELRRIHLGRNIAKVYFLEGKEEASFQMALDLVRYTVLDSFDWPLSKKTVQVDVINQKQEFFVLDQLLNQLGEVLMKEMPTTSAILKRLEKLIVDLEAGVSSGYKIIQSWCKAFLGIHNTDQVQFFESAIHFFENHKGLMPKSLQSITSGFKNHAWGLK